MMQKAPKVPECPNGLANLLQNLSSAFANVAMGKGCLKRYLTGDKLAIMAMQDAGVTTRK